MIASSSLPDAEAIRQLRRREGRMAELGSEDGVVKLDWVEAIPRLLSDPAALEAVEEEAAGLWARGIRQVIWAGMGGSVMAVRVLVDLGFGNGESADEMHLYPLDSTDPTALNEVIERLCAARGTTLPPSGTPPDPAWLRGLLSDVLMVAVAMGMTSEEPITHLEWFTGLLATAGLDAATHCQVLALPDSLLDRFAHDHAIPQLPLQLDGGTGTGGRMSAPATRVFLLPAALWLASRSTAPGRLRAILRRAWEWYDLDGAEREPDSHPFVYLASSLSETADRGAVRLLLDLPKRWDPLLPWIEQLMEESLGKDGKGIMVFSGQSLTTTGRCWSPATTLHVSNTIIDQLVGPIVLLDMPGIHSVSGEDRLSALAANFLGWQLTMALFGFRHGITFAGQPAVEDYKSRARQLRQERNPVASAIVSGRSYEGAGVTLIAPPSWREPDSDPAAVLVHCLTRSTSFDPESTCPLYFDVTFNGELPSGWSERLEEQVLHLANDCLGIPGRVRRAPAAYHATEQSEMDGPRPLVSLRILRQTHESVRLGAYSTEFLAAQAVATWQAMVEQGHDCFLLLVTGDDAEAEQAIGRLLETVSEGVV